MAARKRALLKPKSSTTQNGSSSTTRRKSKEAIGNGDVTLYLRLSLLIVLMLGVCGFLLYPDILSIIKTVRENSFKNLNIFVTDKTSGDKMAADSQQSLKNEAEEDLLTQSPLDDTVSDEDIAPLLAYVEEGDLMEDEEDVKKDEYQKSSQTFTLKDTEKNKTETKDTKDTQTAKDKTNSDTKDPKDYQKTVKDAKNANAAKDTKNSETAKNTKDSKAGRNGNDSEPVKKQRSSTNMVNEQSKKETVASDKGRISKDTEKPQIDEKGKKRRPIILNSENREVVLDPSQIKFVDSPSDIKDNTKQSSKKKPTVAKTNSKKQEQKKSSTKANAETTSNDSGRGNSIDNIDNVIEEAKKFNSTYQKTFTPKKIFADGRRIPPMELLHQKESNSSVRVFLFDDFLSEQECDGLIRAHDNHVKAFDKPPLLCFDSIGTLRKHLRDVKKNINVTPKDFTKGTKCVNASFSEQLQTWMKSNWSYSTAFYPGESTFSKVVAYRIRDAMGLDPASGGKFQITSYPEGKAYKEHTDCTLGGKDERDRVVSVLMYLSNVEEGGETTFPELGIWVRPKKGRALVWNNMSPDGVCEEHSKHVASVVKKGSKYILIRWYYYKTFYSLGRRPTPPHLPERDPDQPMVNCDEYNSGSCRWYDEWSYEPLLEYNKNRLTLI